MLRDEFNQLMALFQAAAEGNPVNMEEIFKQSLTFFEKLKAQMSHGSQEDKMKAVQMMTQMYEQMMAETKKIAQRAGMTEEQLTEFAKNPANFSKEQWEKFQSSKGQIEKIGDDIITDMKKEGAPSSAAPKKESKIQKLPPPNSPRAKWMKS
jgi:hypothetical protein